MGIHYQVGLRQRLGSGSIGSKRRERATIPTEKSVIELKIIWSAGGVI